MHGNAVYTGVKNNLSLVNCEGCLHTSDVDKATASFYHILDMATALFVPLNSLKTATSPVNWGIYQNKITSISKIYGK